MNSSRRRFLELSTLAAASTAFGQSTARAQTQQRPRFPDADPKWSRTWDAALAVLVGNIKQVPRYDQPVMVEGAEYKGIWQECGPHEGLVYATLQPFAELAEGRPTPEKLARDNHMAFFALQKEDGQLPASVKINTVGYAQLQMVVPIAATAWELYQRTHDAELLQTAYAACSRWDAWLRKYRNTRNTGLVEGFCCADTGHDNSPRWEGIPLHCPNDDAKQCNPLPGMPRLCPDLSATVYGARIALAAMARELGKKDEAARWEQDAETIRKLILKLLWSPEDAAFYDLDSDNKFVRVRSDVNSRVLGEHVLKLDIAADRNIFEALWSKQLHNPKAFWTPFPFPSIAFDDPRFVRPIPRNSWGGASQALTALRTPRWMPHYGKQAEFRHLMQQWVEAISRHTEFRQQLDPQTGDFTRINTPDGYSPAALVYLDFVRRLG